MLITVGSMEAASRILYSEGKHGRVTGHEKVTQAEAASEMRKLHLIQVVSGKKQVGYDEWEEGRKVRTKLLE